MIADARMSPRRRRRLPHLVVVVALVLLHLAAGASEAQELVRTVGRLTVRVDLSQGYPGGLLVVHLSSRRPLGHAVAVFGGRRLPFFSSARGPRALVPVPVGHPAGPAVLGIEVRGRRRRERFPVTVTVEPRAYAARTVVIPEHKRAFFAQTRRLRDSRELLLKLRTETPVQHWNGPFRPPVDAQPLSTFGEDRTFIGGSPVEGMMDSVHGEYHRGLDYPVPAGTLVQAPAAGTVVLAETLSLTGQTVVLDHGHGLLSVFYHLGSVEVREGQWIEGRTPLGVSGESGIAASPHVHWGVYVHQTAVDPRALAALP